MSSHPGISVWTLLAIALLVLAPTKDADALVCSGSVTFVTENPPSEEPQSAEDCAHSLAKLEFPGVRSGSDGGNLVKFGHDSWVSDFHVTVPEGSDWLMVDPLVYFKNYGDGEADGEFDWNVMIEDFTVSFVSPFPEARLEEGDQYEWAVISSKGVKCLEDCFPISFDIAYTMDVPEPGTILLMGIGLSAFGFARRRTLPAECA